MRSHFYIALLLLFFPFVTLAADTAPPRDDVLMAEPNKEQVNEARNFLNQCNLNDQMQKRHNCKCMALQYLEKRVHKGDKVKPSEILSELRNTCLWESQKDMKDLGYKDMSKIPQEVIDEGEQIHAQCMNNFAMRTYHDCDCIAGKFIDDRMRLGPLEHSDSILAKYQGSCKNSTELAGYQYTKCMDQEELMVPREFKPKYYCECYGSEFAKANEEQFEQPHAYTESILMNTAARNCTKRLAGKEKYAR